VKYSEITRRLKKEGWKPYDISGKHPVWYNPETGKKVRLGHHPHEEVSPGMRSHISKETGIKF
jgi:predicted RNA binding protein YcfA (HicA-like mRNA interferase family)